MPEKELTQETGVYTQLKAPSLENVNWVSKQPKAVSVGADAQLLQKKNSEVEMFLKNVWFLALFFILLLTIASFGIIAET